MGKISNKKNELIQPIGFRTIAKNLGIKDVSNDFVVIVSDVMCSVAGVFTQSRFSGPSVEISRENISNGRARGIIAISKNANVANGIEGRMDAENIVKAVGDALRIDESDFVLASTGVIGRRYPMERILPKIASLDNELVPADFKCAAEAIMTTDIIPKYCSLRCGDSIILGIAKGVGMIEPNMATLLAFFMTDASIESTKLERVFKRVIDRTLNCVSVDTDTSTSDTAVILANGMAGSVNIEEFEAALETVALNLTKMIARDGEGASKIIEVKVGSAHTYEQAKKVAKSIVNSPLVKTAIHGADPNWGRVAMAIGKCSDEKDLNPEHIAIAFGDIEVYPRKLSDDDLCNLKNLMQQEQVFINVSLGLGIESARVWGCDLSAEYVSINADYTT